MKLEIGHLLKVSGRSESIQQIAIDRYFKARNLARAIVRQSKLIRIVTYVGLI